MFKTYDLFDHRNINDLVPEIVYYYLFKGLSLTAIEQKLFKTEDYHGWLSKTLALILKKRIRAFMQIKHSQKL